MKKYYQPTSKDWCSNNMVVTPETLSRSPLSTTSSDLSTTTNHKRSQNPVKRAVKSVAEIFIACLTPPDDDKSSVKKERDIHPFKSPSVSTGSESKNRHNTIRSYISKFDSNVGSLDLTIAQIYKATRNFSPSLKLGQGGFGTVYKAVLDDGTVVAVKRAKRRDYDDHLGAEFRNEIRTLSQVEHLNLVKFYGFLDDGDEQIVVVEYVPNGNLREHLDGMRGDVLDMAARLEVAIDVAHAITYLHMYADTPLIHRDIKSSNILLTERFRAKVADFGFARVAADKDSGFTHVSTQVKGTAGYLDPEYLRTYHLTEKSDVYSFGVLLVELITGRRAIEPKRMPRERITPRWAITKFTEGDAISTMDPRLEVSTANVVAVEKILELAFICLAPQSQNRPTMQQCGEILWSIRKDYRELLASDTLSLSPSLHNSSLLREESLASFVR